MNTRTEILTAAPLRPPARLIHGPVLQRACACGQHTGGEGECAECRSKHEPTLQRVAISSGAAERVPPIVHDVLGSPGQPLDAASRAFLEPRFGHDFSGVRVHTDGPAAESARAVHALAYTVGRDVVFGAGQYTPGTGTGRRLLAHELAHVVQQSVGGLDARPATPGLVALSHPEGSAEQAAEQAASGVMTGRSVRLSAAPGEGLPAIQREPLPDTPDMTLKPPPLTARLIGSDTLDAFILNSATLTTEHKRRLGELVITLKNLLRAYPGATLRITGHTDATGGEELNEKLGQQRADAVRDFLTAAGVPDGAITTTSAGESELRVQTNQAEPRNRRVQVRFEPEGSLRTPQAPLLTPPTLAPPAHEYEGPPGPTPKPDTTQLCIINPELCRILPGPDVKTPRIPPHEWLKDALEQDLFLRKLPKWARERAIDALKDADELAADKVIDALPIEGTEKAAMKAAIKSILQLLKGKKFKPPEPPPRGPEWRDRPEFPKMPGERIFTLPPIRF